MGLPRPHARRPRLSGRASSVACRPTSQPRPVVVLPLTDGGETRRPSAAPARTRRRQIKVQRPDRHIERTAAPSFRLNDFLTAAPRSGRLQEKRPGSALSVAGSWVKVRRARNQSGGDGRPGRGLGPSPAAGLGSGEDPEIPTGHDRNTGIGVSSMPTATRCLSAQRSIVSRSHPRIGRSAAPMTPLNPPQPSSPAPVESTRCFHRRALPGRAAA
jgi:hypothetical protein